MCDQPYCWLSPHVARRIRAVFIARTAAARAAARACLRLCDRPGSRALAAGVTWTSRTLAAEWAGRFGHTSVIDAAGAIYVIGGGAGKFGEGFIDFNDVWKSADGGARPDSCRGVEWLGGY